MTPTAILSRSVPVASIPQVGIDRAFSASEAERAALAEAYGLLDVRSFSAVLTVMPESKGIVAVRGRVKAEIVQACVVTLDPVGQTIDEPVDVRFALTDAGASPHSPPPAVATDSAATEPPEPLHGDTLDLGAVAVEHFVLAIDPYPRAPGAVLKVDSAEALPESDSPFAALAGLRDKFADND